MRVRRVVDHDELDVLAVEVAAGERDVRAVGVEAAALRLVGGEHEVRVERVVDDEVREQRARLLHLDRDLDNVLGTAGAHHLKPWAQAGPGVTAGA